MDNMERNAIKVQQETKTSHDNILIKISELFASNAAEAKINIDTTVKSAVDAAAKDALERREESKSTDEDQDDGSEVDNNDDDDSATDTQHAPSHNDTRKPSSPSRSERAANRASTKSTIGGKNTAINSPTNNKKPKNKSKRKGMRS